MHAVTATAIFNERDLSAADVYYISDINPYDNRSSYYVKERKGTEIGAGVRTLRSLTRTTPRHITRVRHR